MQAHHEAYVLTTELEKQTTQMVLAYFRSNTAEADKIIWNLTDQTQWVQDYMREGRRILCHAPGNILEKKRNSSYKVDVSRVGAYKRRRRSAEMLDSFIERMKRIHCPNEERPPAEQRRQRADFDARTLIKCLNSTQKAGV